MQLVNSFLEQSAERLPDKVGLICNGRRLTYRQLDDMANRLANALVDHGVRRGDRVVLMMHNRTALVVAIFAVLKADAVFVVVNESTKEQKLHYVVDNCRATAIIVSAPTLEAVERIIVRAPSLEFGVVVDMKSAAHDELPLYSYDALQEQYPATRPQSRNIDRDLACLVYTSGSTGRSKGVMCAHSSVVFAATSVITYLENTEDDVIVNLMPLSFDYGLYQVLMAFKLGATLVLEQSFAFPANTLRTVESEGVTGLPGVPTMFSMLLNMDLSRYDLSSIRYITSTAAALPVNHIEELKQRFPQATIYSMYGLTETQRTLYLPPDQLDKRPESVGIAIPGTEVWIEDEDGNKLGPGEVGELVARGGHVMAGYWEKPRDTIKHFRPGPMPGEQLCYTGDLFRMDEEGYCYFVGRKDDIIKSSGEKVSPREIEDILYMMPDIQEAAVVGVPDEILGEAVKVYMVPRNSSLTEMAVLAHCKRHLEDFMLPKHVQFCKTLPKTGSGKIDKRALGQLTQD